MIKKCRFLVKFTAVIMALSMALSIAACKTKTDGNDVDYSPIESVKALGFVDTDGPKVKAVALEYGQDMSGADVTAATYSLSLYKGFDAIYFSNGQIGDITKVYVHNKAETDDNGGTGSGNYVICEVFTDYLSTTELDFVATMVVSVTQVKDITLANGEVIAKSETEAVNTITTETVNEVTGKVTKTTRLDTEGFIIPEIEGFKFYTDTPGNYGADGSAFVVENCFDQRDGLYYDEHLAYALWVPDDWHADGNYAMVTLENPAASVGTHPLTSVLQTRSPAYYATKGQEIVKEEHGLDGMIVVVPVVTERVDDNGGTTAEYEAIVHLWDYLIDKYHVNENYVYGSGQSVGGMILMETQRNRDNFFAGLLLYEDQWAQNYYMDTLFVRFMATTAANQATQHYPRTDDYITWDYHYDNDGNVTKEDHDPYNYYYMISDDNMLVMQGSGAGLCVDTWNEMSYLYQDLTGKTENGINQQRFTIPTTVTRDAINAANTELKEWLNGDKNGGTRNINAVTFTNGISTRLCDATYEWLLTQTRTSEMERSKLDINKPFQAAETQIRTDERKLHFNDADGNDLYFITGAEGAGTRFYNTSWLVVTVTTADAAPGWLPEGMGSWVTEDNGTVVGTDYVVQASEIVDATVIENGKAVAIRYSQNMENLYVNLVGDKILKYGETDVYMNFNIVVPPFTFYDADGNKINCNISKVYVNTTAATVAGAESRSGSGNYIIVEFETALTVKPVKVVQSGTLHTDKCIASAFPWKYDVK